MGLPSTQFNLTLFKVINNRKSISLLVYNLFIKGGFSAQQDTLCETAEIFFLLTLMKWTRKWNIGQVPAAGMYGHGWPLLLGINFQV